METEKIERLKGMRDFFLEEMIFREKVFDTVKKNFELFGFSPLETPAMEYWNVLAKKGAGGSEILKETYKFKDKGNREVGLRYDLTVPLARFIAMNPNVLLPFKRYQIGRVWRYSDISKGRLREFWQADVDIIGSDSMLADAEVIACATSALKALGFKNFKIRLNNRKILSALIKYSGINEDKIVDVFRIIDKLDKVGIDGVKKELRKEKILEDMIKKILEFIRIKGNPKEVLSKANEMIGKFSEGKEGINELEQIIFYLDNMVDISNSAKLNVDLSLARGLDYYTGPIFEIQSSEKIGSVAGGGRYDKMISLFSKKEISATGISLGIERIIEVMKDKEMVKTKKTKVKVFVANVNNDVIKETLEIAKNLRTLGIETIIDLRNRKLDKQLEFANAQEIPYTVIVGPKELKEEKVTLRNMKTGEQKNIEIQKIKEEIKII